VAEPLVTGRQLEPFEVRGEATLDGDVLSTIVSTRPGYTLLGAEVLGDSLLSITFRVDEEHRP
jgi:hypothetical protein